MRERFKFFCAHCDTIFHAGINAAWDILHRAEGTLSSPYTGVVGRLLVVPEAQLFLSRHGQGSQ